MNLFVYMPTPGDKGDELLKALAPYVSRGSLDVFSDLPSFAVRARQPKDPFSIALIWDPSKEDLREIARMRDFLTGVRTLLVLPDQETETIALAHKILPNYITYIDEGVSEVVSVLDWLTRAGADGPGEEARRR
jgi:hypothetical protein